MDAKEAVRILRDEADVWDRDKFTRDGAKAYRQIADLIEQQAAVLEKLQKTADGAYAVDGMPVWWYGREWPHQPVSLRSGRISTLTVCDECAPGMSKCFSTRAAAEAAAEKARK
jgi:hypothetical protein